jgi:hypothetical protein
MNYFAANLLPGREGKTPMKTLELELFPPAWKELICSFARMTVRK